MERIYTPHPIQLYTLCLPLLIIGTASYGWGWEILGATVFILGALLGLLTVAAVAWREHSSYADRISEDMRVMDRVHNPDVWAALGYSMPLPEQPATIHHQLPDNPIPQIAFPRPPITDPKMKIFSDAILMGKSIAESEWGGSDKPMSLPEIRKLKTWLEHPDRQYIRLKNSEHPQLGYRITPKGREFFLFYASDSIRAMFLSQNKEVGEGRLSMLGGDSS